MPVTETRSTHTAPRAPRWQRPLRARVTRTTRVSPNIAQVTVGGEDLAGFGSAGPDEWFRLFLPRPGQRRPLLPESDPWWEEVAAMPADVRPTVRNYTIRRHRPDTDELDIEFILHEDEGPASAWAQTAAPGDEIGILLQGAPYDRDAAASWRLVAGDETALPAMSAIVESLPPGQRACVFAIAPSSVDARRLETDGDVDVTWVFRDAAPGDARDDLLAAVRAADLPSGAPYAWLAGEARLVRDLRRHLVGDRGVEKEAICFLAYWRHRDTALDAD